MAACSHGAGYDACPPASVSREFNRADKRTGILRKAEGGEVMMSPQFGALAQPRMQPNIGRPAPDQFAPTWDVAQLQPPPWQPMNYGMEYGGGGAIRQHFDQGGAAGDAYGDGRDPDAGGFGGADMSGWGDPGGALGREPADITGQDRTSGRRAETGLIGVLGSMMGIPGLGLLANMAERAADFAEAHGIATDRDPATGISAGGMTDQRGGMGDEPYPPPGALTQPAPAPAPTAAPSTSLPGLPALRRPAFDPTRYGFGPAIAWLR